MGRELRFAVLGDPIEHSKSPAIHAAALRIVGLEGRYDAIRADEALLADTVEALRAGTLDGVNVTMPLKAAAAEMADVKTVEATRSDSVNTLRFRKGLVEGHSTDAVAFSEILQTPQFSGFTNVLILGAGGSARAAIAAMDGRNVYVSSRDTAKSGTLAGLHPDLRVLRWLVPVVGALVINATPLGMGNEAIPEEVMLAAGGLIDLPYADEVTRSAKASLEAGKPLVDGYEFLARQAAASFQWWTGARVDFEPLVAVARNT